MLMRSKLFVPGSRPELFLKAESEAGAISFARAALTAAGCSQEESFGSARGLHAN